MLTEVWVHLHLICARDACGTQLYYFWSHLDHKLVWRTRDQKVMMLLVETLERDILMLVLTIREVEMRSLKAGITKEIDHDEDKCVISTNQRRV